MRWRHKRYIPTEPGYKGAIALAVIAVVSAVLMIKYCGGKRGTPAKAPVLEPGKPSPPG